jgi:hypothetical protein
MPGGDRARCRVDEAFQALLRDKREVLAARWREIVVATYSPEAARFMTREADPFSNPVGHTLAKVVGECLDYLVSGGAVEDATALVGDAMRIRAVQSFSPSTAVGWLFQIKRIVREELGAAAFAPGRVEALLAFEARVDALVLSAFDAYLASREKLYEIKATELRRRSERVIEKLNERLSTRDQERERSERGGKQ